MSFRLLPPVTGTPATTAHCDLWTARKLTETVGSQWSIGN